MKCKINAAGALWNGGCFSDSWTCTLFLMSCVFYAVFWNQRPQAKDEIFVVCVLKDCFFVTAVYGKDVHLCQIQIIKCIITVAGIQMRLCSVNVIWKQKTLEFSGCRRVTVRNMLQGRSLYRKWAMPHLEPWCKACSEGRIQAWHLEAPLGASLWL